jgi:hypothetical protein
MRCFLFCNPVSIVPAPNRGRFSCPAFRAGFAASIHQNPEEYSSQDAWPKPRPESAMRELTSSRAVRELVRLEHHPAPSAKPRASAFSRCEIPARRECAGSGRSLTLRIYSLIEFLARVGFTPDPATARRTGECHLPVKIFRTGDRCIRYPG